MTIRERAKEWLLNEYGDDGPCDLEFVDAMVAFATAEVERVTKERDEARAALVRESRRAAEDMRERAAVRCENHAYLAHAIRALPIDDDPNAGKAGE